MRIFYAISVQSDYYIPKRRCRMLLFSANNIKKETKAEKVTSLMALFHTSKKYIYQDYATRGRVSPISIFVNFNE